MHIIIISTAHVGSCLIEENSGTSIGSPSVSGRLQTTYSCVAFDNCNYEVHVIGNYESRERGTGDTDVVLTVTGESPRPLILVLISFQPVRWRLNVTNGVTIDRVILVSFEKREVTICFFSFLTE